ncbi:SET domain-containing protein [Penicillium cinerascens]|uniref:SET domain-containing protein n=1 Tax=Penicillium cinerascens TaxID=70096 RepID=A0A9W9JA77_9EURO|nr:SET domain-containing protein [Penicillium cinerascens]KAJ5190591.1 SET domain-containing protein [Penicillium cinerascens]
MHPIVHHPVVTKLLELFENADFSTQLASELASFGQRDEGVCLRIDAVICAKPNITVDDDKSLPLGWLSMEKDRYSTITPNHAAFLNLAATSSSDPYARCGGSGTCPSASRNELGNPRHKTVSGLRPSKSSAIAVVTEDSGSDSDTNTGVRLRPSNVRIEPSFRQLHSDTRFPQRKRPTKSTTAPTLQPSTIDKLVSGIWRQVHSPVNLSVSFPDRRTEFSLRTGVSQAVFQEINGLCKKYYDQSRSSRALEMVVQAYWVECYEARIASIRLDCPTYTNAEARMAALKEACNTLGWQEKELRNRMAVWRGYKEIKDSGGWASLIFAGSGVYRFCKYRIGFDNGLTTRLRHTAFSLEVAADTLHPGWRDLLHVINQNESCRYSGHPHEWVTVDTGPALPLKSTYSHLALSNGFNYEFVDDCMIDREVFGEDDPRRGLGIDPGICQTCKERQSDDGISNHCSCFPSLFGGVRHPPPVQLYHTASGKNNGVIARCPFERGTAIAEFVGLVTYGIDGLDVMIGGTQERPYQIFQGQKGNFTRFINHSCRPNSQFQRFYWRGIERILVVSRGVSAGSEITVNYSDSYWRKLQKNCLCGEPGCRFAHRIETNAASLPSLQEA